MHHTFSRAAGPRPGGGAGGRAWRAAAALVGVAALATTGCKDSVVPNFEAPQVGPLTPAGVAAGVAGVMSGTRVEIGNFVLAMSSFARDAGNFTNTDSRYITEWLGDGIPIPNSDFYGTVVWDNEFRLAKAAQTVIDNVPKVTPAYTASDAATIIGIMQTMKAYEFMLIAESHDTLGVPIGGIVAPPNSPAPILCAKDAWAAIVAILDSGETALASATAGPLPVALPPGFAAVAAAGPPGTGTFADFNRALRAKAGLEYAYAVARATSATTPTPTSAGTPLASALTAADAAAKASVLFGGGTPDFVQTAPGNFADPLGVYQSFSGASGDIANPIQGGLTTIFAMDEAVNDLTGDPRGKKLVVNSAAPGQPAFNAVVSLQMTTGNYPTPSSPIPIIRSEELVLIDAAIQLGLGNNAGAVALINAVRAKAGATPVAPAGYAAIRDALLHEFRASVILEPGEERTIMIRNYGVAAVADTTWGSKDLHTTVIPIPTGEASARNNNTATVCP